MHRLMRPVGAPAAPATGTGDNEYMANDHYVEPAIAAWTIIQDVGTSFFGTEIPTPSIAMSMMEDVETSMTADESYYGLDCYVDAAEVAAATTANITPLPVLGEFKPLTCGLIPERHNNGRSTEVDTPANEAIYGNLLGTATVASHVWTRFDVQEDTKSDVFVWLGNTRWRSQTCHNRVLRRGAAG